MSEHAGNTVLTKTQAQRLAKRDLAHTEAFVPLPDGSSVLVKKYHDGGVMKSQEKPLVGEAPLFMEAATKRMDEMTLADYRRAVAKSWHVWMGYGTQ